METVTEEKASDPFYIKCGVVKFDLYCCDSFYRSIIARFGDEDHEYYSHPDYVLRDNMQRGFEYDPDMVTRALIQSYCRSLKVKLPFRIRRREYMKKFVSPCRFVSKKERLKIMLVDILNVVDILIFFGSLTKYRTNFHTNLLFSPILEEPDLIMTKFKKEFPNGNLH